MDLNKEIQIATDKIIKEQLSTMVESKVSKMVDDVLKDIFSSYGETAKAIKTKIQDGLNVSLLEFNLTDYNVMVAKTIASQLEKEIDTNPIAEIVKGLIGKSDLKQIKIYDLCEKIKEIAMEKDEDQNWEGDISFFVNEDNKHGWIEISADTEADKCSNKCSIRVLVSESTGRIFSMSTRNFLSETKEVSPSNILHLNELESLFFSLYNNQVHIINDFEEPDTNWCRD